jgi:hypothetical protein
VICASQTLRYFGDVKSMPSAIFNSSSYGSSSGARPDAAPALLFEDAADQLDSTRLLSAVDGISSCLTSAARRGGTGSAIAS